MPSVCASNGCGGPSDPEGSEEAKKEGFVDKLKFWEETRPRQEDYDLQLQVRTKLDDYHRDYIL